MPHPGGPVTQITDFWVASSIAKRRSRGRMPAKLGRVVLARETSLVFTGPLYPTRLRIGARKRRRDRIDGENRVVMACASPLRSLRSAGARDILAMAYERSEAIILRKGSDAKGRTVRLGMQGA